MRINFKKIVIFLITILIPFWIYAQKNGFQVNESQYFYGVNSISKDSIKIKEFTFSDDFYKVHLDSSAQRICCSLRSLNNTKTAFSNVGYEFLADLETKEIGWSRKVKFNNLELLEKNGLIYRSSKKFGNIIVNDENGEQKYHTSSSLDIVLPEQNIALGYTLQLSTGKAEQLYAIDLRNGNRLWERKIPSKFGLEEYVLINDSTLIISSGGLHKIDLRTGKGWSKELETDYNFLKIKRQKIAKDLFIGGMLGVFIYNKIDKGKRVNSKASNFIIDNDQIIMTSVGKISSFNLKDGSLIWENAFSEEMTSASILRIHDKQVIHINLGYMITSEGNLIPTGKPFLASYKLSNGERVRSEVIHQSLNDKIVWYYLSEDEFNILSDRTFTKYSFEDLKIENELNFKEQIKNNNELKPIAQDKFIENEGRFFNLKHEFNDCFLFKYFNQLFYIKKDFSKMDFIDYEKFWNYQFNYKNLDIVSNSKALLIVNKEGMELYRITSSSKIHLYKNELYLFDENKWQVIDLEQFIL